MKPLNKLFLGAVLMAVLLIGTAATIVTGYRTATTIGTNSIAIIDWSQTNGGKIYRLSSSNLLENLKDLSNWPMIGTGDVTAAQLTAATNPKQQGSGLLSNLVTSGLAFPAGPMASNVNQVLWTLQTTPIPTNSAISNMVVNFRTNHYDIYLTNNLTLTNFAGINDSSNAPETVLFITPQLVNRGITYPTLGGSSYGVRVFTNANNPIWQTLTQGITYSLSISSKGTNLFIVILEWK